jgi:starch synthase (maltosyl-transferring)
VNIADSSFFSELETASGLGFNTVLVDEASDVQSLLKLITRSPLDLMLRLSIDRAAPKSKLLLRHPDWFDQEVHQSPDALPDPRVAVDASPAHLLRLDDQKVVVSAVQWWVEQLSSLAERGVAGFALHIDGSGSPGFFRQVIEQVKASHPKCKFWAWTVGVPAERVVALGTSGFDGAFTSSAWWDFQSCWLEEEADRLGAFKCLIATAGKPGERVSPSESHLCTPWLWVAASTGDGVMMTGDILGCVSADTVKNVLGATAPLTKTAISNQREWKTISPPGSMAVVLLRSTSRQNRHVIAINPHASGATVNIAELLAREDGLEVSTEAVAGKSDDSRHASGPELTLGPCTAWVRPVQTRLPRTMIAKDSKRVLEAAVRQAAKAPRIAIENISPCIDSGRFRAKRCVGDTLHVEADLFGEGHDRIAAAVRWREIDDDDWHEVAMHSLVNDRWHAKFLLPNVGTFEYQIEAWIDVFGAYRDEIQKKNAAGQQLSLEFQEGMLLIESARLRAETSGLEKAAREIGRYAKELSVKSDQQVQADRWLSADLHSLMMATDERAFKTTSMVLKVDSERRAARFSSWYELFPRSMGIDATVHGTFADVLLRLPAIKAMGFDTLYFPPIHPIGLKHRKGRNNSLAAGPDDLGSPYAIGSEDGGHDAIHPQLGTLADFRELQQRVQEQGMELALDFAIQCSPDHPWLKEHPDWFTWRPDGTIRYAENPPKKYQDIVNVDFYAQGAIPRLWIELRNVVLFWIKEGVKLFRVDNPHTKPMPFWEWMIADVRSRHADVIFLAEAFTRPKPMYRLAKLGFSQSYTYFTWRHTKREFIDYLTELTEQAPKDFFRPHFFVNTPDINPYFLQRSGRAGFVIRAALATTLSGLWGMYSGFEICEGDPVPGKEEYLDSEKYELRHRDWNRPGSIVSEITALNKIRRENPALQTHLGVRFCKSSGEDILCFTKTSPGNVVFVAICLDPHVAHTCEFELPLEDWQLGEDAVVTGHDLVHGHSFRLNGRHHQLGLDPSVMAFSIWRLKIPGV